MYEMYSCQSLPEKNYRELLGTAICVFNNNNNNDFIIENILRIDNNNYNWYELIDKTSGQLTNSIRDTITKVAGDEIENIFSNLVEQRNRIIHSFRVTNENKEQSLFTKDKTNKQFEISNDYLLNFIRLNSELSRKLHKLRGY